MGRALAEPTAGPNLAKLLAARRGGRVVIVLEDTTRHSPLPDILPVILREIDHAGIQRQQVEVFFATGMHPPMTPRQVVEKLGPAAAELTWRCNPWKDEAAYEHVGDVGRMKVAIDRGVLEADLRIIVSSVSIHMQAGFGGGYKMFLPGCASLRTIRQLHRHGLEDARTQLVGTHAKDNLMRRAIDAAGQLIDRRSGASFAVQYLLDAANLPGAITAGEVLASQQMLAKQAAVANGVLVESPADIVIANAYPRDADLWQSFKAIANTRWALRPNGVMICLTRCESAMQGMNVPRWPIGPGAMRRVIRWLGAETFSALITRLKPSLAGDAAFFIELAAQALHRNPLVMFSPILHATGGRFPGLALYENWDDVVALTRSLLGEGPQRVVVFPTAGTTYPVPPER